MDNEKDMQDFSLEDIMRQLQELPQEEPPKEADAPVTEPEEEDAAEASAFSESALDALEQAQQAFSQAAQEPEEAPEEAAFQKDSAIVIPDTPELQADVPDLDTAPTQVFEFPPDEEPRPDALDQQTQHFNPEEVPQEPEEPTARVEAPQQEQPDQGSKTIPLDRSAKLRELKRKLVAGPEKRYYVLSEQGIGRLQIAMILNFIILLLCGPHRRGLQHHRGRHFGDRKSVV